MTVYDGETAASLQARLGLPRVVLFDTVGSTLDVAHELAAAGAAPGTLVLADRQVAGRGRSGKRWTSAAGAGIWLTLVERPADAESLAVLPLRLGLHAAEALEPLAGGTVRLKWPNDLQVDGRKLAGILVEARWREGALDWIAVGMGVNVRVPADQPGAAALADGDARLRALLALVPALRRAAAIAGPLSPDELSRYRARDAAAGRRCVEPVTGIVRGITAEGELAVDGEGGEVRVRSGSLVFAEDA